MSKRISLVIMAVILMFAMVIPSNKVYAANKKVNSVDVTSKNGKIVVNGTVEEGMLAIAVQLLDENGKLVSLETGSVDENNKYSVEIESSLEKFTVKVADYDGGETISKTIPVEKQETNEEKDTDTATAKTEESKENEESTGENAKENPKTGDNFGMIVSLFIVSVIGALVFGKKIINTLPKKH